MLKKDFQIFTHGAFLVKQITLRELILVGTNFCENSDLYNISRELNITDFWDLEFRNNSWGIYLRRTIQDAKFAKFTSHEKIT